MIFVFTEAAGREECVCVSFVLHIYIVPLTVVGLNNLKCLCLQAVISRG